MAVVMCYYNGANPTVIEELVTRPLESAAMSVSGVKELSSSSNDGSSVLQITYEDGTDLDIAATRLREQFDMITLPEDASKPIIMPAGRSQQLISIGVLICCIPLIILYIFTQRTFVESIAMSGSKE